MNFMYPEDLIATQKDSVSYRDFPIPVHGTTTSNNDFTVRGGEHIRGNVTYFFSKRYEDFKRVSVYPAREWDENYCHPMNDDVYEDIVHSSEHFRTIERSQYKRVYRGMVDQISIIRIIMTYELRDRSTRHTIYDFYTDRESVYYVPDDTREVFKSWLPEVVQRKIFSYLSPCASESINIYDNIGNRSDMISPTHVACVDQIVSKLKEIKEDMAYAIEQMGPLLPYGHIFVGISIEMSEHLQRVNDYLDNISKNPTDAWLNRRYSISRPVFDPLDNLLDRCTQVIMKFTALNNFNKYPRKIVNMAVKTITPFSNKNFKTTLTRGELNVLHYICMKIKRDMGVKYCSKLKAYPKYDKCIMKLNEEVIEEAIKNRDFYINEKKTHMKRRLINMYDDNIEEAYATFPDFIGKNFNPEMIAEIMLANVRYSDNFIQDFIEKRKNEVLFRDVKVITCKENERMGTAALRLRARVKKDTIFVKDGVSYRAGNIFSAPVRRFFNKNLKAWESVKKKEIEIIKKSDQKRIMNHAQNYLSKFLIRTRPQPKYTKEADELRLKTLKYFSDKRKKEKEEKLKQEQAIARQNRPTKKMKKALKEEEKKRQMAREQERARLSRIKREKEKIRIEYLKFKNKYCEDREAIIRKLENKNKQRLIEKVVFCQRLYREKKRVFES